MSKGLGLNARVAGFVSIVSGLTWMGGCGGSTGASGSADSGGTHDDGASSVVGDAGTDGAIGSATEGGTDASSGLETGSSVDGSQSPADGGGAETSTGPEQCPAPTGEAGAPPVPLTAVCSALVPSSPSISTFDGASPTAFDAWGTAPLVGGTYVFPACSAAPPEPTYPLFEDYSADNWHVTGTVGTFSGFGVWWVVQTGPSNGFPTYGTGMINASAYGGIQFDISGNPGPLGAITLAVFSANQQSHSTDPSRPNCGMCDPDAGLCDVVTTSSVAGFTGSPRTVQIRWADLASPRGQALDPAKLVSISWNFPWIQGGTPYQADVTIDNLQFLPASAADAGTD
jgi:hypothetical protein